MRFNRTVVAATAFFAVGAIATEYNDGEAPEQASEESNISKPSFTPTEITGEFVEQFTDGWDSRWQVSSAKKDDKEAEEEWAYVGTWNVEEPSVYKGIEGDNGLVLKDKAAHHAISAKFPKKIDNKGKDLVVQYEVKLQDGLQCGGAYMKLLQENKALHAKEFSNASPYIIMFGPDKCGTTNKVHFILRHKNPKTGEYEEKHMTSPPRVIDDKLSHLYTLIVKSDNDFEILVDGESKRNGTLLEDMTPSILPPTEIDDPKDKKPSDWVDEAKIADPEASKPEDWDEDAPFEIVDEEAEKPDDWLEDEPLMIPDPEAEKPEDWDDEEDGDWAAPMIPNPKCADVSGCGPWEKPMIKNPEYKGKWVAPKIDNPDYQGIWAPRKIPNPDYFEDKHPSNMEPMGAIGFELWTMQADILFDNIYIGHSIDDAKAFQKETFDVKTVSEKAEEALKEAEAAKQAESASNVKMDFMEDPVTFIKTKALQFKDIAQQDPVTAIKTMPEVAGVIGVLIVTLLALVFGGIGAGASSPQVQDAAKKAQDKASEATKKASDAVSSGAEKVQAEAAKRNLRSSGANDS